MDRLLHWLKWPSAGAALLLLPGSGLALWELLKRIVSWPPAGLPFLVGAAVYLVLWRLLFRRPIFGSYFSTLEHELTHAVFAWATFHRVIEFRATWRQGGHIIYSGQGNWLITIAPYFFPTICVFLGVILVFLPADPPPLATALMGTAFAYHITSTHRQTHGQQTDIQQVGSLFAWMFLPTANLIALGAVVAFSQGGAGHVAAFVGEIFHQSAQFVAMLQAAPMN